MVIWRSIHIYMFTLTILSRQGDNNYWKHIYSNCKYLEYVIQFFIYSFWFQVRWVVESANGRIKSWRYLDRTLPNSQIPHIGDYVRIVSALCNKYRPPLSTGDLEEDTVTAAKMKYLCQVNRLHTCIFYQTATIEVRPLSRIAGASDA